MEKFRHYFIVWTVYGKIKTLFNSLDVPPINGKSFFEMIVNNATFENQGKKKTMGLNIFVFGKYSHLGDKEKASTIKVKGFFLEKK
jgi:hypothetical protein